LLLPGLGSQSLQSEEGVTFSPRKKSTYQAADGSTFDVTFSADAEVPTVWESPKSGQEGRLLDQNGVQVAPEPSDAKVPRTHWDMLLERRTRAELEELLQERLDFLRARKGQHKIGA
jgi:thioesterase domain-containing protein